MNIKRLLTALAFSAFVAAPLHAAAQQGDYGAFASDNALTDDWGVYDEDFAWNSDEGWFDDWSVGDDWDGYGDNLGYNDYGYYDDYGYGRDLYDNSLGYDDYGVYDRNYAWGSDREFDSWRENAHYDWLGYDDAGDEGWFDF